MGRLLSVAVLAASYVAALPAQESKIKEPTKVETDDAKIVTWVGCLRASKDGFDLTEVTRGTSGDRRKEEVGTPPMVMLRLLPGTVDLQKYVGRRVSITGATEKDVFEDIEVEVRKEKPAQQRPQSTKKTMEKAEVDVDPKGHNILVPVTIREVSKSCR
jgi:hypothetical protein